MRDERTKQAFIKYLQDPKTKDLRFWQAIRNFWGAPFVLTADHLDPDTGKFGEIEDTYYIEGDEVYGK